MFYNLSSLTTIQLIRNYQKGGIKELTTWKFNCVCVCVCIILLYKRKKTFHYSQYTF